MANLATKEPARIGDTAATVIGTLGDQTILASELIEKVGKPAAARAWAAGEIEFGRRKYCTNGQPRPRASEGKDATNAETTLIVEKGEDWTGPKKYHHKPLTGLLMDDEFPVCTKYMIYQEIKFNPDQPNKSPLVEAKRDEVVKLLSLYVRLTDKGLAGWQSA